MAKGYIQSYSGFIGADMSSDPRAVARNRLAYSVNMWRDYESDQGEAIETFPGFRIAVNALSSNVHGLYHYRTRSGVDYVIAHFGEKLYAFEKEKLAAGKCTADNGLLEEVQLADADSTGFVYNNNLYILDGSSYWVVTTEGIDANEKVVAKDALADPYIPTTYYNGKPYEQRNMLTNTVYQYDAEAELSDFEDENIDSSQYLIYEVKNGVCEITGIKDSYRGSVLYINGSRGFDYKIKFKINFYEYSVSEVIIWNIDDIDLSEAYYYDNTLQSRFAVTFKILYGRNILNIKGTGFDQDQIEIYRLWDTELNISGQIGPFTDTLLTEASIVPTVHCINLYDPVEKVINIKRDSGPYPTWVSFQEKKEIKNKTIWAVSKIYFLSFSVFEYGDVIVEEKELWKTKGITAELSLFSNRFTTVKNGATFNGGNPDYKKTSIEAIKGCTKAAVYDGRVFLTGNPDLPNTTFYTHRNLTGANDPTYFGVYNYFNDGVGNTPNVELLALPNMLMVLKNDTVSDGSIYYHVGQFNTDEDTMGLLPRIYPATTGAAGLGSVGENDPGERRGNTTCNFLDDPVFLSRRGLEAVGKEQVNLERSVTHRSSNVDRLLIKENLSEASIAEWKGYLVICVNGNMYLADSRHMSQHPDGSVQYEWYYLEGLKTYGWYATAYKHLENPGVFTDEEWEVLNGEGYQLWPYGEDDDRGELFWGTEVYEIGGVVGSGSLYYRQENGNKYILERAGGELIGSDVEYPAKKIIAAGQHLIFGTDRGDLCIINTDKRGANVGGREVKADVIDYTWYTFAGVRYVSGCSTKLDDCDQRIYTKTTIPGTTTVRFKTMLNSSCRINSRVDGENWSEVGSAVNYLGRATSSELDFGDINFANFAFAGNDNNVVVVPEISRCWINKQYYVYSDGYAAPFGLYELSYAYKSGGKIRY